MATSLGALSTVVPPTFGGDTDAQKEYIDALTKVTTSLENRNQPNYFSIAGQLLNPGRTGSFGEALGNASTEYGRQHEARQVQEPNIAMMRAQIAGQKYNLTNDTKALQLMGENLNISPGQLSQLGLNAGSASGAGSAGVTNPSVMNQGQLAAIQKLYPTVAQLSPERGKMLEKMYDMGVKNFDLAIKAKTAGIDEAKFKQQYGFSYTDVLGDNTSPKSAVPGTIPSPGETEPTPIAAPGMPTIDSKLAGMTPDARNKAVGEMMAEDIKSNAKFKEAIPEKLALAGKQGQVADELTTALTGNEAAFGLLKNNPGVLQAVGTWLNEGLKVGNFAVRLPVNETLRAVLKPKEQLALQQVEGALNQLAINNAALLKGSVSNYEDKMVKSVTGSAENTAEFLKYIGKKIKLQSEFDKQSFQAFDNVSDNVMYKDFVNRSPIYKKLKEKLDQDLRDTASNSLKVMGVAAPAQSEKKSEIGLSRESLEAERARRERIKKGQP